MKKMFRQNAIIAVERTDGLTPESALLLAEEQQEEDKVRVFAADYIPAIDALLRKGYSVQAASQKLVELGVPFAWVTLASTYYGQGKNYKKRPQAKKRTFTGLKE